MYRTQGGKRGQRSDKVRMTRRGSNKGLSLLEVLITLMLLSTTLIAFAAVYPAAFKLNRKTHRSVQAAELAGAVAEELRTLPFNRPAALEPGDPDGTRRKALGWLLDEAQRDR